MSFSLFHPINFFNIDAQETVAYATNFTYPLKNVSVVLNDAQKLNEPCKDTHLKKVDPIWENRNHLHTLAETANLL